MSGTEPKPATLSTLEQMVDIIARQIAEQQCDKDGKRFVRDIRDAVEAVARDLRTARNEAAALRISLRQVHKALGFEEERSHQAVLDEIAHLRRQLDAKEAVLRSALSRVGEALDLDEPLTDDIVRAIEDMRHSLATARTLHESADERAEQARAQRDEARQELADLTRLTLAFRELGRRQTMTVDEMIADVRSAPERAAALREALGMQRGAPFGQVIKRSLHLVGCERECADLRATGERLKARAERLTVGLCAAGSTIDLALSVGGEEEAR